MDTAHYIGFFGGTDLSLGKAAIPGKNEEETTGISPDSGSGTKDS